MSSKDSELDLSNRSKERLERKRNHSSIRDVPRKKRKRNYSSSSNSSSSDSSTSSSSTDSSEEERRKRKKKLAKKMKKHKSKEKKKKKKSKKSKKKIKSISEEAKKDKTTSKKEKKCDASEDRLMQDISSQVLQRAKAMAPMTKEEWEKRQSVVRKVFDEETGRYRLIKGDGEVLEEIVSRDRHKEINRQATRGDGEFFQSRMNLKR